MKIAKLTIVICMLLSLHATAQNTICSFDQPIARNVYVFSENRNHTIIELFGKQVPTNIMNLIYVANPTAKLQIDSMYLNGAQDNSVFIFPNKDAQKTIRYCTSKDYLEAIKNKIPLKIERNE